MKYNPDVHHHRSIRLKGYDYSQAGAYFVTICTQNRECLLGDAVDGEMRLNEMGKTIMACWQRIPEHFRDIEIDEFIVMPNHVHGIIVINHNVGAQFIAPDRTNASLQGNQGVINQGVMNHAPTVGNIVRAFKVRCAYTINRTHNTSGITLWQRNYYEHIIHDETEMNKIQEYIINNPLNWEMDENYKK